MNKLIYGFALFVALITMVICLALKISPVTTLFRGGLVFLGVLFIFFIGGNLLQWTIALLTPRNTAKGGKK